MGVRIRPGEGSRGQTQPGMDGQGCGTGVGQDSGAWLGGARGRAGPEMASYGLTGAGTDGSRGWNGALSCGQGSRSPGGIRVHECTQVLCLQTNILISVSANRNVT